MSDASLSSRAVLVSLTITQWSARKLDRNETAKLAAKHGTAAKVARVNKSLLPVASPLDSITKHANEARAEFHKRSLPWSNSQAIVRSSGYLEFASAMSGYKDKFYTLVDRFVASYPQLQESAKVHLNGLYRDEDYPSALEVRRRFAMDFQTLPLPDASSSHKVQGLEAIADSMAREISRRMTQASEEAMREAWRRVYDVAQKAHDRLSDPEAVFRDSLVENAREIVKLLPNLNLNNDPGLTQMGADLRRVLCGHNPETLRRDQAVRQRTTDGLADILDRMGAVYGVAA